MMLLTLGVAFMTAPAANAASGTINGSVDCTYGNNAEVGVWVDATSGNDGWASWSANAFGGINYSYQLSQASSYQLHVGCGGTPSAWGATMYTPVVNGQYYDWVCTRDSVGFRCVAS